jgi:hypothetical protein
VAQPYKELISVQEKKSSLQGVFTILFYFILFYIKKAYRSSNVGSRDFCGLRSRVPTEMSPNSGDVLDATDRVEPNKMPHFFFHRFSQFLVYNKLNNRQKMLKN